MVGPGTWVPNRGEVVWITPSHQAHHEQAGRRPAMVLSPATYNGRTGLALLCPITNRVKGYPFGVRLPPDIAVSGVVLTDQVRFLKWRARDAELVCRLPGVVIAAVLS
ncbi:MAG: type II toxin-antitoxin system PemK/MazF family toxin [Chloroflexi bacterium]|nr:type II toxin-antitoxin system PemK/MazF family toxin [Chloroflexota bacterium]